MNRPTVHDIAKEAGVSLATVDRVLNARPGVREKTIERVQTAVQKIGYVRDTYAANLARQRQYRFAFVLPEGPSQFAETIETALNEAYSSQIADRIILKIVRVAAHDPHAIVRALQVLSAGGIDGIAIMMPETPQVRDAIARLREDDISVVALVSDLPNSIRNYFIGINNIAAGRTAAQLMGKFLGGQGEILVVTNSMRSRDSLERRLGFDNVVGRDFPNLIALPSIETYDDPERLEHVVANVVRDHSALRGVYSMGSGNTMLLNALRGSGRLGEMVVIAHEITPTTRRALIDDEMAAVIAQNVGHLVRSALRVLRNLSDQLQIFDAQERLRIDVILRENLP